MIVAEVNESAVGWMPERTRSLGMARESSGGRRKAGIGRRRPSTR